MTAESATVAPTRACTGRRAARQCHRMRTRDAGIRHFAAIAEAMAGEKRAQRAEVLRTTPAERVALGFVLGAVPLDAASQRMLDERAAGQLGLAQRRRARSLT